MNLDQIIKSSWPLLSDCARFHSMHQANRSIGNGTYNRLPDKQSRSAPIIMASRYRRMPRCRPRAINADQYYLIWHGLTGGYGDKPTRNIVVGKVGECAELERMVRMGLLTFVREVPGFRRYDITEAGAAAVGLWLPED
jgi:hypothetical protein